MLGIFRKRSGEEQPAAPGAAGGPGSSCTSFILVILDSCRYDTFMQAAPTEMTRLGAVEKRYSYASWTAPSHYNMLMGLMPHTSPKRMFASDYYRQDFLKFNERLGSRGIEFRSLVPGLYPPARVARLGPRSGLREWLANLAYLGVVSAAIPWTLAESAAGRGAAVMVEARPRSL